jgi:hypothetical protein
MNEKLEMYKKYGTPPEWAKKPITGGRLKGMTDINPQWRIECLTEQFGMIGIGWYYQITKQWIEEGGKSEKAAFVNIDLFVKVENEWSKPIPGTGGSSFIAAEKNGEYTSDECFKMATTDALSVACKMLGIGSAIYSGSKYPTTPTPTPPTPPTPKKEVVLIELKPDMEAWYTAIDYVNSGKPMSDINKKYFLSDENYILFTDKLIKK